MCKGPAVSPVQPARLESSGWAGLERWAGPDRTRLQGCGEETGFYSECDEETLGAAEQ